MANAWFRMYSEFANDPKVQMLSEADQRRYIMVLCMRCGNDDVTLQDEEVAFQLRISNDEWASTKRTLVAKGLVTEDNKPTAWDKRQFVSDSSAERVARHRANKKQACNVTEAKSNALDTDTDTDKEDKSSLAAQQPQKKAKRLSPDWQLPSKWGTWTLETLEWDELSVRRESEKFKDYWTAKGGREACKLDWEATWRNWCRNAKVQTGQAGASLLAGGI
jgi:hypothetical protein